jgi:uncharacterized membrane protein SpoIIM required for sporulation
MAALEGSPGAQGEGSARKDLLSRGRILLIVGAFLMEMVIFFGAMVIPMDQATQQTLQQAANGIHNATSSSSPLVLVGNIFANNVRVALVEMIPAVGALVFFVSIFTTGQIIQVVAASNGLPGAFYGVALFVFPFSIVELSAYALAVGSGSMLIVAWRRRTLRREVRVFVLEILAVVGILLIAAAMETTSLIAPVFGLTLWFPLGLFIAWLAIKLRRNAS